MSLSDHSVKGEVLEESDLGKRKWNCETHFVAWQMVVVDSVPLNCVGVFKNPLHLAMDFQSD